MLENNQLVEGSGQGNILSMEGAQGSFCLELAFPQEGQITKEEDATSVQSSTCWFIIQFTSMESGEIGTHEEKSEE